MCILEEGQRQSCTPPSPVASLALIKTFRDCNWTAVRLCRSMSKWKLAKESQKSDYRTCNISLTLTELLPRGDSVEISTALLNSPP